MWGVRFESFVLFLEVDSSAHKLRFVFPEHASGAPSLAAEELGARGPLPVFILYQLVDLEQKKKRKVNKKKISKKKI